MTRLEQVEQLRARAHVSYDEAKKALDEAQGELLDALILLETQGKVAPSQTLVPRQKEVKPCHLNQGLEKAWRFCLDIFDVGNRAGLVVEKEKTNRLRIPLTVLLLLLIFAPWLTVPMVLVGWVLGYQYSLDSVPLFDKN